jgi:hypothetical protein
MRWRRALPISCVAVCSAAMSVGGCRTGTVVRRPEARPLAVSVRAPMEPFPGVRADDQTICAGAQAYTSDVAETLRDALPRECGPCAGRSVTLRLLLRNDPWRRTAAVAHQFPVDGSVRSSGEAYALLLGIMTQLEYPALPLQRHSCVFDFTVGP